MYNTDGYQLHRKDRMGKSGGGILVYVKNSLQTKRREDLEADDLEILWLEVCPYKSSRSLFIGGVYRPPSFRVADDKRLGENIENVHLLNKETDRFPMHREIAKTSIHKNVAKFEYVTTCNGNYPTIVQNLP